MRHARWLCLLLLLSAPLASADDIQVTCEPGLRIYLDGSLKGTSTAREDGLFLANVPEGPHTIRVEKDGFEPQVFQVQVPALPIQVKVEPFSPQASVGQVRSSGAPEVKQPTESLLVTSAPQNCVVEIDGRSHTKDAPQLLIDGLAAGEHTISFSKPGYDRISRVIRIQPGTEVTVRGDLIAGKVEVVHEGKGSLRVISTPERCTVRILGETKDKIGPRLNVSYLPAGEHRMVVSWKGRELSTNVLIKDRQRTIVTVSFMKNDVPFMVSYEPE
jgi:hypothetical protein